MSVGLIARFVLALASQSCVSLSSPDDDAGVVCYLIAKLFSSTFTLSMMMKSNRRLARLCFAFPNAKHDMMVGHKKSFLINFESDETRAGSLKVLCKKAKLSFSFLSPK